MGRRKQSRTILFHSTTEDAAASILGGGFEDATGNYLTNREWSGVWVSDVPLDVNEGAKGNVLLRIDLAVPDTCLSEFEWVEEDTLSRVADTSGSLERARQGRTRGQQICATWTTRVSHQRASLETRGRTGRAALPRQG